MGAVRLRNMGEAVHLYAPPGEPNSLPVDEGQVVTVGGPLTETDDAWICGEEDAARAFPKSRWSVVEDAAPAKSSRKPARAKAPEPAPAPELAEQEDVTAPAAEPAEDEKGGDS